jgi:RND family efflux transporter MFP subunit
MWERVKSRWVLGGAALVVLLSAACVRMAPVAWSRLQGPETEVSIDGVSPSALATAAAGGVPAGTANGAGAPLPTISGRQPVPVKRGPITESVTIPGRIAGQEEVPLSMTAPGRVQSVNVRPGQGVDEGQVLLEMDARQIQRDLSAARARLDAESLRLRQAQAQAQAKQADENRTRQVTQSANQRALSDAEAALLRAQSNMDKVRAGAAPADREAAEAAVSGAQAGVAKAQADLDKLNGGANPADVAAAEQAVNTARLAQQKAEADLARVQSGPDAQAVRDAQVTLAGAQNDAQKAQADLDALTSKDPRLTAAAEREVDRARVFLQAAESTTGPGKDVSVANAQIALKDAQDRLAAQQAPAPAWQVDVAKRNVDRAKLAVASAQDRLDKANQGSDPLAVATAQSAVDAAKLAVQNAEARLQAVQAGPTPDAITAATNALNAARSQQTIAEGRRSDLLSHPTDKELREAQALLTSAQTVYDRARADASQPGGSAVDLTAFDLEALQQTVASAQAQVDTIERELAATKLKAPFAGTVIGVQVRSGDPLEPGQPAVTLSKTGDALIKADLNDASAAKVQPGQGASILLEGKDQTPIPASVLGVVPADSGVGSQAQLQLQLPEGASKPAFGASGQVTVNVQSKDNVLIVPAKAVRSAGNRRYVEYMDGSTRRIADVQVGITSGNDVEILSGLNEGQVVLVSQ